MRSDGYWPLGGGLSERRAAAAFPLAAATPNQADGPAPNPDGGAPCMPIWVPCDSALLKGDLHHLQLRADGIENDLIQQSALALKRRKQLTSVHGDAIYKLRMKQSSHLWHIASWCF